MKNDGEANLGQGHTSSGSVDNALRILLMFESHETIRVAEIAREFGIAKSTAHRLLAMLEHHRYVRQSDDSRAYCLGPALLEVGLQQTSSFDLREAARPRLELLRDETGESCGLLVLDGAEAVMVDFVAATHPLRVVERIGDRAPAHLTAAGKALLAGLDPDELSALYPAAAPATATLASLPTVADLAHDLETVRRQGVATNMEESGPGVVGIAAPVPGPRGRVVAAVLLALPTSRLGEELIDTFGATVRSAAAEISKLTR
ncbi:IclR family transcriptional regulator [Streptomyces fuscichromogenes]|uniref:IclR family transcriptional regulator n=1 Tax=Streptomyces fuscichromogenes TaxID=1324013 RepID=UPI0037F22636